MTEALGAAGFTVRNQTKQVDVSGSLGYTLVTFEITANGPEGKTQTETGHVVRIWKKRPDGTWKITIEIWNSDQPVANTERL